MSHVFSLSIVERIRGSIFCPLASLSVLPIIVDKPISCRANDVDMPVLLLSFDPYDFGKFCGSGCVSKILSKRTWPHLLHIVSPGSASVIILLLPQMEHNNAVLEDGTEVCS